MDYNELIERYGRGELDAEQADLVERDIQRHAAISSYLAEKDEDIEALFNEASSRENEPEDPREFTKKVRKQIRRSFLKAGLITGLAALAAALFCVFALPRVIDRLYYDPTETVGFDADGGALNRMSLDIAVYSELFLPENYRNTAEALRLGYGRYSIYVPGTASAGRSGRDTAGVLERGRLELYDAELLKRPDTDVFDARRAGVSGRPEPVYRVGKPPLDELVYGMGEGEKRLVYVTFKQPMDYSNTLYWCLAGRECRPLWGAICAGGEVRLPFHSGIRLDRCGADLGYNSESYPDISIPAKGKLTEEMLVRHAASLFNYAADNADVMGMLAGKKWDESLTQACRETADAIEAEGLMFYGVVFYADAETIRGIYLEDQYSSIYVSPQE